MSDYNILTLLNVGDIYHNIILNMTFLMFLLLWFLVALMFLLVMTMRTTALTNMAWLILRSGSAVYKTGGQEEN